MLKIGQINTLRVVKTVDFGVYLDGLDQGEILLPTRFLTPECTVDNEVDVFIYFDSEDRLIATTEFPYAQVGDFAILEVVAVNQVGAFLDWGIMKDILVPFREQKMTMEEGKFYTVHIYLDHKTQRIVASAKIDRFLDNLVPTFKEGDEVNIFICEQSDLGYKAIIENTHWGIIYKNEVFRKIKRGEHCKAYIKKIREDDKIDLSLEKIGYDKAVDFSQTLLEALQDKKVIHLNDNSTPEEITKAFGVSKKTFKKAVGALFKQKLITINETNIELNK